MAENDDRVRLNLLAEAELAEKLDLWRSEQGSPIPSRSDAMRRALTEWLDANLKRISTEDST